MDSERNELLEQLEHYYRAGGWRIRDRDDMTVRAVGPGGVEWIGVGIVRADLENGLGERLLHLADVRMPEGQLCPLDLLPTAESEGAVRALLARLGLDRRRHVSVYASASVTSSVGVCTSPTVS
ncbi:MAG: hypothetical protein ACRDPC_23890 [Solirubrobacteraceae bacterium]